MQITFCNLDPDTARIGQNIDFNYALKSTKSAYVSIDGKKSDGTIDKSIPLPIEFKDKTDWAQSGMISFTLPQAWSIYTEVIFTLTSGGESDSCVLTLTDNQSVFEVGDEDSKTATYNGSTISVGELKELLVTLGYLSQTDVDIPGYTSTVNQAFWNFLCAVDEANQSTLDPSLRLQTADNPLMCGVTYEESPSIQYIEDVSIWIEVVNGLKARVGQDISAFINPATIGTLAAFIAWNAILPVNAWLLLVVGIIGTEADITSRYNEVQSLWNNPSDLNIYQTKNWKIGYTIGTLLTALPAILPANIAEEVKVAEEAVKLDNFTEIKNLVIKEQQTINETGNLISISERQNQLNKFVDVVNGSSDSAKAGIDEAIRLSAGHEKDKVLTLISQANDTEIQKLKDVILERTDIIDTPEVIASWKGKATKDTANPVSEGVTRSDALNTSYSKIGEVNVNNFPIQESLQKEGIFRGQLIPQDQVPTEGYTLIQQDFLNQFDTIGSLNGIRFFTRLEDLGDIAQITKETLISKLSLDPQRYNGPCVLVKFSTLGKIIREATHRDSGFSNLFRNGGYTKGGAREMVTTSFPKSEAVPVRVFE